MARPLRRGEVLDENAGRTVNVDHVGHGAVSDEEWRAMARALVSAKTECNSSKEGTIVEIGTLSGKTTHGLLTFLENFRWYGVDVLTIDKEASCCGVLRNFKPSPITKNELRFHHGTAPQYFGQFIVPEAIEPVRFAFVDGCHCQDCVAFDIITITPFMLPGAVLVFHDAGNQRELGMNVHERYHGDGEDRLYGVREAIQDALHGPLKDWYRIEQVDAADRGKGAATPIRGGLDVWQRSAG